jgi:DnaJ-class molecular chaperone
VQECFADEVAIDFPSVGRAVERMRDGFLREDDGAGDLETELRLSMIEARRGLVVPLDVPMRCTCPTCNGRGGTWRERCDRCAGTGEALYHHQVHVSVPPGVSNGARLRFRVSSPQAAAPVRVELRVAVRSPAA